MKNLFYICLFLFAGTAFAQEKTKNVSEETTVKTIKTNNGEKITENKVKVTTREEQNIEFDEKDKDKRDKDVVNSPVKVLKTLEIDDDKDNFYDSKVEIGFYEFEGTRYNFTKSETGFLIHKNEDAFNFGKALRASEKNHYLFKSDDKTGVGYFNDKGNFAVEYYNNDTGKLEKEEFIMVK
jgi:hypothetical protein